MLNTDLNHLSVSGILGVLFRYAALIVGVPLEDATTVGGLMGPSWLLTNLSPAVNMVSLLKGDRLDPKSTVIATFKICGFGNFSSVAMLVGGLGELAPDHKYDLTKLGIRAMTCGALASCLSAPIASILFTNPAVASRQSTVLPVTIILPRSVVILDSNLAIIYPESWLRYSSG